MDTNRTPGDRTAEEVRKISNQPVLILEFNDWDMLDTDEQTPTYKQEQFMRRHGLWSEWNCYSRKEVAQIIRNYIVDSARE